MNDQAFPLIFAALVAALPSVTAAQSSQDIQATYRAALKDADDPRIPSLPPEGDPARGPAAAAMKLHDFGLLDPNLSNDAKSKLAAQLIEDLRAGGVLGHAAGFALNFALLPWQTVDGKPTSPAKWQPAPKVLADALDAVLPLFRAEKTPDDGTRNYLITLSGAALGKLKSLAAAGDPEAKTLFEGRKFCLLGALTESVRTDPSAYAVEPAVRMLGGRADLVAQNPSATVRERFAPGSLKDGERRAPYTPVQESVTLGDAHAAALADPAKLAELLKGVDDQRALALNERRLRDGVQVTSSHEPWGCGSDLLSLVRGPMVYRNLGNCGGPAGPALLSAQDAGSDWGHVTIDLRAPRPLSQVRMQFNGAPYAPARFNILVGTLSPIGAVTWVKVAAYTAAAPHKCISAGAECELTVDFPTVVGQQIRFEYDATSVEQHVWLNRFNVGYAPESAPAA